MRGPTSALLALLVLIGCCVESKAEDAELLFESKVRPVLVASCFRCHGDQKTAAALRVDSREALLKGGDSGPAIVPGKPGESLLIQAIERQEGVAAMPPDKDKALREEQVAAVSAWIEQGAVWPAKSPRFTSTKHWAFEPLRDVTLPTVHDVGWVHVDLDRFIRARQEAVGVRPAPQADRRTLIRRATYSVTGLPPTAEEVEAFVNDPSPHAFEKVIDRLLASPEYGEHWGRRWLDLVRYADTAGENSDHPLPHAWRYRNWVIQSFNRNQPADEFLREQIAGDLLAADGPPEKYSDRVIATGYLALARRFGHDIDKDIHLTLEDTIDTLGKSMLGLTIGCARCHDHKYDPLSARDYYGLYGIFESTRFAFPGCEPQQQPRDLVPLLPPDVFARSIQPVLDQAAKLDAEIKRLADESTGQARGLKELAAKSVTPVSSGLVDDATGRDLPTAELSVKPGDVVFLAITARGNHGADTTRVEFTIKEAAGDKRRWSVDDLVDNLPSGNPHADTYGHAAAWSFFDARDGYAFLPERMDALDGRGELKAWRNGDTPAVFVNSSDRPVKVWTTLAPKAFFMHPGPNGPVALAWVSPMAGTVQITGHVSDAHPGGDGFGWILEHCPSPELAGEIVKASASRGAIEALRQERKALEPKLAVPVAYAVREGARAANARVHKRGEPTDLGDEVPRKFLDVLGGQTLSRPDVSGRRELAEWLTGLGNPLTPRVFVNRIWQGHFGRGLVTTPNDFGSRGALPTHPELLDFLAKEFVASGWNVKTLHRRILLSAAWQTSSEPLPDQSNPPELYTVFPRRRLTAEELRDSLLFVTGELDREPGGAHPFPPEATWNFTQHTPFAAEYESSKRSVYLMQKRNRRTRFFALFDGPDPNASTPQRDVTTVPTQALYFLNDPFVHERGAALAKELQSLPADQERLEKAWRTLFGRSPTPDEAAEAREFVEGSSWSALARSLLSSNEFLYVD